MGAEAKILANLANRGGVLVSGKVPAEYPLALWRVTKPAALRTG